MLDFIRIACAVPGVKVGDVLKNTQDICHYMAQAEEQRADLLLFPELALTGYTCGDLFFQDALCNGVKEGMKQILAESCQYPNLTTVLGLPVRFRNKLFNCAAVFRNGQIYGLIPKTYIPNYGEFSEHCWFSSGEELPEPVEIPDTLGWTTASNARFGCGQLFALGEGAVLGVEICEDLLSPIPVSSGMALNGANVIANLSASNETVGKRAKIEQAVVHQSGACKCIYAYCSAGYTESTSDLVISGHSLVAENGKLLKENGKLLDTEYMFLQDCDLGRVNSDRVRNTTFRESAARFCDLNVEINYLCERKALRGDGTLYPVRKLPFVPSQKQQRYQRCMEIFQMQVTGLKQRLSTIGANAVIGISGGLDSTLALLVAVEAMHQLGRPLTDVYCVTMPCFGTSDRTYRNAWELMRALGVSAKEINIREAVTLHFRDIGHDSSVHNATFENAQARERTQILMDYASVVGGIVVGTGDLSELALGWCTYNGDHMSMYSVNGDVPKTLIRWIIDAVAQSPAFAPAREVLQDVLDTPISPELLPPDAQGKISQQTEDLVGPYALHDFFLYYMLRFGFTPKKIYTLACRAFAEDFDGETVKKWLKVFYKRFFTQQFKRNCLPDGVKVGSVGLSPRGDWKMPSDASARLWLEEMESL